MPNKLVTATAWTCLVLIVLATLSPAHLRPRLTEGEPALVVLLERFSAFAVLGFLFSVSYPRRYGVVCILVFGSAIVLEMLQIVIPDRDARLIDAAEKLAGGAAGVFTAQRLLSTIPETVTQYWGKE